MAALMDEQEFRRKADRTLEDARKALLPVADEHDFEVEFDAGTLNLMFEEPQQSRFVISPNTPVRQIWVSALARSFKLGWSEEASAFVLEKTGETLLQVLARLVNEQLGTGEAIQL